VKAVANKKQSCFKEQIEVWREHIQNSKAEELCPKKEVCCNSSLRDIDRPQCINRGLSFRAQFAPSPAAADRATKTAVFLWPKWWRKQSSSC